MTIAQQLNVKEFPFSIFDKNGNQIYWECLTGYWYKREYDSKGNDTYWEDSRGYWYKREYDSKGNDIYWEDSRGYIKDNRPKQVELTLDDIAAKFNIDVNLLKIKK